MDYLLFILKLVTDHGVFALEWDVSCAKMNQLYSYALCTQLKKSSFGIDESVQVSNFSSLHHIA